MSGPRDQEEEQDDGQSDNVAGAMDDEEDIDEDEVIDVAEQIFVKIAEQIIK